MREVSSKMTLQGRVLSFFRLDSGQDYAFPQHLSGPQVHSSWTISPTMGTEICHESPHPGAQTRYGPKTCTEFRSVWRAWRSLARRAPAARILKNTDSHRGARCKIFLETRNKT